MNSITPPPQVSVIIPVYNAEKYIRDTILQIKAQTLKDFECILIDDNSTDRSVSIIEESIESDARFILVKHAKNMGKVHSLNEGINLAKGKFIQFLDDDDIYDKNLLLEGSNMMERDTIDVLCCNYSTVDDEIGKTENECLKFLDRFSNKIFSLKEMHSGEDAKFCLEVLDGTMWSKMFRRDFLVDNVIVFRDYFPSDDIVFSAESIIKAKKISVLNKSFVIWRKNNMQSASGSMDRFGNTTILALDETKTQLIESSNYISNIEKVMFEEYIILVLKFLLSRNYENADIFDKVYQSARELLNKSVLEIRDTYDNKLRELMIHCDRLDEFLLKAYRLADYENKLITEYNESLIQYWKNELGTIPKTWRYKLLFLLPRKICLFARALREKVKSG